MPTFDSRAALLAVAVVLPPAAQAADDAVSRGQALYEAKCSACHSVDAHRVGPLHRGVLGRKAGSAKGYDYSPALAASALVWTRQNLERWLADPEALIPGQRMGFSVQQAGDRQALVAYLASLKP